MALPVLNTQPVVPTQKGSITLCQKEINKGLVFAAMHRGASTVSLGERFALSFTRIDDRKVDVKLLMFDIETKSYTNVVFRPKVKTVTKRVVKKKPKFTKNKESGVDEL